VEDLKEGSEINAVVDDDDEKSGKSSLVTMDSSVGVTEMLKKWVGVLGSVNGKSAFQSKGVEAGGNLAKGHTKSITAKKQGS
jgi:hypothetical protein